jgi:hypothetical protein
MIKTIDGELLHELTLSEGHALEFYDFGEGAYGVREHSNIDAADGLVLHDVTDGMSLVEIYRLAKPEVAERDIPRKLIEADRAVATRTSVDTGVPSSARTGRLSPCSGMRSPRW